MIKDKQGIILITVYIVIVGLLILGSAFFVMSASERRVIERERDFIECLYLAEAGIDKAIEELCQDYSWSTGIAATPLGKGEYSVTVEQIDSYHKICASGFIPNAVQPRVRRALEAYLYKDIPADFFENVLYVSSKLELKENYLIDGNIVYGGLYEASGTGTITEGSTVVYDPSADPLALLDFNELHNISSGQGNVFDEDRLEDVEDGLDNFPSTFWYDELNDIPNVVFVESNLELKEDFGNIGGFFIVVGDVLTDPESAGSIELEGNGNIEGCIYTNGKFEVKGGEGGGVQINGSVWVGERAEAKGNTTLSYNPSYATAISNLNISSDVQMISWREIQ